MGIDVIGAVSLDEDGANCVEQLLLFCGDADDMCAASARFPLLEEAIHQCRPLRVSSGLAR